MREGQRQKLLRAHYAGAVPEDVLADEMKCLTRELVRAEVEIKQLLEEPLVDSPPDRLLIGEDGEVERAVYTEPFAALVDLTQVVSRENLGEMILDVDASSAEPGQGGQQDATGLGSDRAGRPDGAVLCSDNGNAHRAESRTMGGLKETYVVALVQTLAHPCYEVQRVFDMATTWATPKSITYRTPSDYKVLRTLKAEEVDELVGLFDPGAGVGVKELALKFGVHRATVSRYFVDEGSRLEVVCVLRMCRRPRSCTGRG